jgi:hypothetical protein
MKINLGSKTYRADPVLHLIPFEEFNEVMSYDQCELDPSFMGFTDHYGALASIVPLHYTIVDLGCYLAAQSYFFAHHTRYIGVDVVEAKRFTPPNAEHYTGSIQSFIDCLDEFKLNLDTTFAIMNYVPDDNARRLVKSIFKNLYVFYPSGF